MATKKTRLSDGIRAAVNAANKAGISRYAICKECDLDQASMSRFMAGDVGFSLDTLEALAEALNLSIAAGKPRMKPTTPKKAR